MSTTIEKPKEATPSPTAHTLEGVDTATMRWAIGVVALFVVCVALGAVTQRIIQSKKNSARQKLIAHCQSDPSFNQELCSPLLSGNGEARIRSRTLRNKASKKAPFQLSGQNDDLTPGPQHQQ